MRKADGVRTSVLAHAIAYHEHFPKLDRPALAGYLLNMLCTLRELHGAGVMVGDYNPANFLCHPGSAAVTLIDCDSWQVNAANKTPLPGSRSRHVAAGAARQGVEQVSRNCGRRVVRTRHPGV